MTAERASYLALLAALLIGIAGCVVGAVFDAAGFFRAWLCSFLLWLGLPLAGIALVMVHDLTGGRWMATARPLLNAAIATMPLAILAGVPALIGLHRLFPWEQPGYGLANRFYLNGTSFYLRYAIYAVLWNLLAAYALFAPRGAGQPIAPASSWLSGLGLVLLACSAGFAAIDWILSVEPDFWSSVFPMIAGAGWFNTGLALVLFVACIDRAPLGDRADHMADLAAILLATTIFWAYVEFIQFLVIWEENLRDEIPWYLVRMAGAWRPALYVAAVLGFFVPFFALISQPAKRSRVVVATVSVLILFGGIADKWWLILPVFVQSGPFWLDAAAIVALGAAMLLLFALAIRYGPHLRPGAWPAAAATTHV